MLASYVDISDVYLRNIGNTRYAWAERLVLTCKLDVSVYGGLAGAETHRFGPPARPLNR